MGEQRKPLLTEEQIKEMLTFSRPLMYKDIPNRAWWWLKNFNYYIASLCIKSQIDPLDNMDLFLAFLRGKTKRVMNIDRLRADVKAWVDDPNRKYPEWMMELSDSEERIEFVEAVINAATDEFGLCMYASSIIGINPDDYFEEVIVEDGV